MNAEIKLKRAKKEIALPRGVTYHRFGIADRALNLADALAQTNRDTDVRREPHQEPHQEPRRDNMARELGSRTNSWDQANYGR